jgi:hypothetical protein
MNRIVYLICLMLVCALSACTAPITKGGTGIAVPHTIAKDIQAAAENLDNAIKIGVLPAGDPADLCVHSALQLAGLDTPACVPADPPATGTVCPPAPASFTPLNDGIVSGGSILYIQAYQLKQYQGMTVPASCKEILGQFVIDGMSTTNKVLLPFLPSLK